MERKPKKATTGRIKRKKAKVGDILGGQWRILARLPAGDKKKKKGGEE
jgi:hypothetical protein